MGSMLEALLQLQDIELQIVDIRRQLAQKERLVRRQTAKLQEAQQKLAAERDGLRRAQMEVDSLDVDLKGRAAHVNKLREQLNSVRTNKEYAALLSQLNTEKAEATRIETKALQLMEGVETRRKSVADHEEIERTESARLTDQKAQAEQVQRTFAEKLSDLQARRAAAAERLDHEVLAQFERISERYEGEVMARIERTHPRRDEFNCGGCHMNLSVEHFNALKVRDEVLTCRNCGRILFIERGA